MLIEGQRALVTGANRGFGRQRARQLRDRGVPTEMVRDFDASSSMAIYAPAGVPRIALDDLE